MFAQHSNSENRENARFVCCTRALHKIHLYIYVYAIMYHFVWLLTHYELHSCAAAIVVDAAVAYRTSHTTVGTPHAHCSMIIIIIISLYIVYMYRSCMLHLLLSEMVSIHIYKVCIHADAEHIFVIEQPIYSFINNEVHSSMPFYFNYWWRNIHTPHTNIHIYIWVCVQWFRFHSNFYLYTTDRIVCSFSFLLLNLHFVIISI